MTVAEFKRLMTDAYIGNGTIKEAYGLLPELTFEDQFSAVSLENIIFSDVAIAMFVMQELYDRFKIDISSILSSQMSGTASWYAYMAMLFQFGRELVPETDYYDNTGLTAAQIASARIVHYAAAVESRDKSILFVKIATDSAGGERQPLSPDQLKAFNRYLNTISYAGVRLSVINDPPDEMRLKIDIYYDPMVLDASGRRLDGTDDNPVQNAIRNFLKNLPFNGTYTNQALVDTLQVLSGVKIAEIKSASSKFGAFTQFTEINAREIPRAGYYHISDENMILTFIPNE